MPEIFVGDVAVGVVPDAKDFNNEMRRQLFPDADNVGREYGAKLGRGIQEAVRISIEKIKADLDRENLKTNVEADTTRAKDDIDAMRAEEEARPVKVRVKADTNDLRNFGKSIAKDVNVTPGGLALGFSPAIMVAAVGAIGALSGAAASLGASFIGASAFGLLAVHSLTSAAKASTAVQKAQQGYNIALANGTKQSVAYKAEQTAIAKAYAGMSPAQIALSKEVGNLSDAWHNVQKQTQPLVSGALVPWMKDITLLMGVIKPLIAPVANLFGYWGEVLHKYLSSGAGSTEMHKMADELGRFSASQLSNIINFVVDIGKGIANLGRDLSSHNVDFYSFGKNLQTWGDSFARWSSSKAARADVGQFLQYLHSHGAQIIGILKDVGKLIPSIFSGASAIGSIELRELQGFLNFVSSLPPGIAKPLVETAGALLLLQKTGVIKVGLNIIGQAADHPYLTGFTIGGLLAAGVLAAVNSKEKAFGGKSLWDYESPPPPGKQQTWLNSWAGLGDAIVGIADHTRHDLAAVWDLVFNNTLGRFKRGGHDIAVEWDTWRHNIASITDTLRRNVSSEWDSLWNSTASRTSRGVGDVIGFVKTMPGRIKGIFSGALTWLSHAGSDVIQGLWNGMLSIWHKVTSWISGIANWIRAHKGPLDLDSRLLEPAGHAIMSGLLRGLTGGFGGVAGFIAGVTDKIEGFFTGGSGVLRWAPLVLQVLRMLGQPASDLAVVLSQMNTESGGNPNAINLSDINAQMGDPSRGLMQVIGTTFDAYAGPFRNRGIYDPLANIFAGLNYAIHRYGPSWTSVLGHGHGYDEGGWLYPGQLGMNFLDRPEPVLTPSQWDAIYSAASKGGDGSSVEYHAHFDGLTHDAFDAQIRRAFNTMQIGQGRLTRNGRRV